MLCHFHLIHANSNAVVSSHTKNTSTADTQLSDIPHNNVSFAGAVSAAAGHVMGGFGKHGASLFQLDALFGNVLKDFGLAQPAPFHGSKLPGITAFSKKLPFAFPFATGANVLRDNAFGTSSLTTSPFTISQVDPRSLLPGTSMNIVGRIHCCEFAHLSFLVWCVATTDSHW